MNRIVGVTELQRNFRSLFDKVAKENQSFILTRGSRAEAVIMPYEQYIEYLKLDEAGVRKRLDETLAKMARVHAHFTDEEVERDLEEATRIVRARSKRQVRKKAMRRTLKVQSSRHKQ